MLFDLEFREFLRWVGESCRGLEGARAKLIIGADLQCVCFAKHLDAVLS